MFVCMVHMCILEFTNIAKIKQYNNFLLETFLNLVYLDEIVRKNPTVKNDIFNNYSMAQYRRFKNLL